MREAPERLSGVWASLRGEWNVNAQRHFESAYVTPVLDSTLELLVQAQQLTALIDQAGNSIE